jgi:hypothetical protein
MRSLRNVMAVVVFALVLWDAQTTVRADNWCGGTSCQLGGLYSFDCVFDSTYGGWGAGTDCYGVYYGVAAPMCQSMGTPPYGWVADFVCNGGGTGADGSWTCQWYGNECQ